MWQAIVREPFLHFLLLGSAVFALYRWVGPKPPPDTDALVVNQAFTSSIRQRFEAELRRPPSNAELVGEIKNEVRRELLYREGQELGLDRDDVIKRRVAEKVEFLAADLAHQAPIEERAVREAYDRERQKYQRPKQVSLRQLVFSADDPERAKQQANQVYRELEQGSIDYEAARARATPSLLPAALEKADAAELARSYGSDFAARVMRASETGWLAPFESGFGVHLVEVTLVLSPGPLPFEEAREDIRLELERRARDRNLQQLYERLRAKYRVRVEGVAVPGLEQAL